MIIYVFALVRTLLNCPPCIDSSVEYLLNPVLCVKLAYKRILNIVVLKVQRVHSFYNLFTLVVFLRVCRHP